ncbi:ATP-binding protein [Acetobacterium wieringae]|uniref:ATP-binding protein n=1 Tax=Acetobacterium wieringae TaxID=52694 RepID=A0A5D0WL90_9FIRM|nr:ATP-binding protein [Acetobacterium wieringae]TYC84884.1 ATP-binding protein [Acetobacterium wieringae]
MAIPISIEKLMNENIVEYARIEFKENWNPEPILHTICAFANDIDNWGGGYIVVGVKEEKGMPVHPVTGIPPASLDRIQKDLLALCHKIKPLYLPVCEPVVYEGKHLLLIWAPGGYERPYKSFESLSKDKKKVVAYVRRFSNTVKASDADLKELHSICNNVPFDDRVNPRAALKISKCR